MSSFSLRKQDPVFFTGLALVLVSFVVFLLTGSVFPETNDSGFNGLFGINFLITIIYFIILSAADG